MKSENENTNQTHSYIFNEYEFKSKIIDTLHQ